MDSTDTTITHPGNKNWFVRLTADPDSVGRMSLSDGCPEDWAEKVYAGWCESEGLKAL